MVTQELINTGSKANNKKGDSLITAFAKTNNNFAKLSVLDPTIVLATVDIDLNPNPNVDASLVLKAPFETINQNFSNLSSFSSEIVVINLETDSLRTAFNKINTNFINLFSNESLVPENDSSNVNFFSSNYTYEIFQPTLFGSSEQVVDIGAAPNDGTGDPLRTAFGKINNNFANLFATVTTPVTANTSGNAPNQVIFSTEILNFNQAQFTIRSSDGSANSQNIILSAQINNSNNNVKFSAYSTTFFGTPVCNYDMDVSGSNVRILCNPFNLGNLTHTIFSQALQLS